VTNKRRNSTQQPSLPGLFAPIAKSRRLATPSEQALDVARVRIVAAIIIFALAYLVIAGRLADLTLMNDNNSDALLARPAGNDSVASRADIIDRNGTVLATSLPTISLCADARNILNADEAEQKLLNVLPDLDVKRLHDDLHGAKHCAIIKRHLTPKQYYAVNALGIAGLEFRPDERRIYPAGNITSHVIGFTDIDNNGLAGMEKELDARLEENQEPVTLALDLRLQTILHNELSATIDEFHALGAAGLVMDISTGEILAMVSLPDFDPQHPGDGDDEAMFNRDTLGVYEMGSTFKIFNTAMVLDSGVVRVSDQFDTVHPIEIGSQTIRDFEAEKRWLNVAEIFTHSSNIGSAHMAERIGGARQRAFLSRLGLTEKAPIELPEVGQPLVPAAKNWYDATTMTVSFGHGMAVSPVQLASAVATIVNDGVTVRPTLFLHADKSTNTEHIISPHTAAVMRGLMRLVVTRGTAKGADVEGYMMGGKTGTADKIAHGHYDPHARLSSFVGVFPLNAPRYLVFAMVDDPKGNAKTKGYATGGWVAAPAVSRVVSQIGPMLNVPPLEPSMEAIAEHQVLKPLGTEVLDGIQIDEGSNYASVESDSVQ